MTTTWKREQDRREAASDFAELIVKGLGITAPPVSPFQILRSEKRRITAVGEDFGDAFDGRLEYHRPRFLLFYNTRYDDRPHLGEHHPRVNFTVAHELAHFFLTPHRNYLKHDGQPHGSKTEFVSDNNSEREADAFAAGLLMPKFLAKPILDRGELTFDRLSRAAREFDTSLLSTTFRAVQLSSLPCALAGLRAGKVAWMLPSDPLIQARYYPRKEGVRSAFVADRWAAFEGGDDQRTTEDGKLVEWFQTYDQEDDLADVEVTQAILPVRSMNTVLVLLTMDEDDLFPEEEEEEEDELDRDHRERFGW